MAPALVRRLVDVNGPDAIEQTKELTMLSFTCANCRKSSIYALPMDEPEEVEAG